MHWYDTFQQEQRANKLRKNGELDQETRMIGTTTPDKEDCECGEGRDLTQDTTPLNENAPF